MSDTRTYSGTGNEALDVGRCVLAILEIPADAVLAYRGEDGNVVIESYERPKPDPSPAGGEADPWPTVKADEVTFVGKCESCRNSRVLRRVLHPFVAEGINNFTTPMAICKTCYDDACDDI